MCYIYFQVTHTHTDTDYSVRPNSKKFLHYTVNVYKDIYSSSSVNWENTLHTCLHQQIAVSLHIYVNNVTLHIQNDKTEFYKNIHYTFNTTIKCTPHYTHTQLFFSWMLWADDYWEALTYLHISIVKDNLLMCTTLFVIREVTTLHSIYTS